MIGVKKVLATVGVMMVCAQAQAGQPEDNALLAFEKYCLENIGYMDRVPTLLSYIDAKEAPKGLAAQLMWPQQGRVWSLSGDQADMVMVTTEGACRLVSLTVDGKVVAGMVREYMNVAPLNEDNRGTQKEEIYAITHPDGGGGRNGHGIVSVSYSRMPSQPGVILDVVPESLMRNKLMQIPAWPE